MEPLDEMLTGPRTLPSSTHVLSSEGSYSADYDVVSVFIKEVGPFIVQTLLATSFHLSWK